MELTATCHFLYSSESACTHCSTPAARAGLVLTTPSSAEVKFYAHWNHSDSDYIYTSITEAGRATHAATSLAAQAHVVSNVLFPCQCNLKTSLGASVCFCLVPVNCHIPPRRRRTVGPSSVGRANKRLRHSKTHRWMISRWSHTRLKSAVSKKCRKV